MMSLDEVEEAQSLCAVFQTMVGARADEVALRTAEGDRTITWRAYGQQVRQIAAGLAELGVRRGDTVAIMLTNRPEFHLVDTAVMHLGATAFSVYNTFTPEQIAQLWTSAGNQVIVCEEQFVDKIRQAAVFVPSSTSCVSTAAATTRSRWKTWWLRVTRLSTSTPPGRR